jgi:hypothetical protein
VISVGISRKPFEPVQNRSFSTAAVHRPIPLRKPIRSVFPLVHTPYDFYERI